MRLKCIDTGKWGDHILTLDKEYCTVDDYHIEYPERNMYLIKVDIGVIQGVEKELFVESNFIEKLQEENKKLREMLIDAKDEMLKCNRDPDGNYYFDSCNSIITYLEDSGHYE